MIDLVAPEVIGAFLTGIAGPMMLQLYNNWQDKKKKEKKDLIKESLETNLQIDHKIEYLKTKFNADRVYIHQFHNGGYFYPTGKSIQKFSMVYETVREGVDSIQQNFQNIPISLFAKLINSVSKDNIVHIGDSNDIFNYNLYYIKDITRSNRSYLFSIRSIDGRFIGILGLDFIKDSVPLSQKEISNLAIEISAIGGVLMNLLKSK
jgi:hypothetical protein